MNAVGRHLHKAQIENPSFSSTLLDVIYRSIDERDEEESVIYRKIMRKRQSIDGCFHKEDLASVRVQRSGASKSISQVENRRKSATGFESDNNSFLNSNVVSSCSGYRVGLSSSETETIYGFPARPRPIRTSNHEETRVNHTSNKYTEEHQPDNLQSKAKCQGKFVKTKARAMKIYGYLKNGKQPISPGGRLATFLLSFFTTGNAKKSTCTGRDDDAIIHANRKSKSANASTSSSASSFSRLCLSKTPSSSSGKLTTGMKRSVRFFPSSVVVEEHSQPRRHKSLHGDRSNSPEVKFVRNSINEELKKHLTEKNRRIEETTRNLLKNYQKKAEYVFDSIKINVTNEDYNDDDDDASYASSDLFELDHLSAIGIERCKQELPLYETTSVDANRAIANGLLP